MIRNLNSKMRKSIIQFIQKRAALVPSSEQIAYMTDQELIEELLKTHTLLLKEDNKYYIICNTMADHLDILTREGIE